MFDNKFYFIMFLVFICILIFFLCLDAKLSDETQELVEDLRNKHYGFSTLYCSADNSILTWQSTPVELVDVPLNVLIPVKGWEVFINNVSYYILLVEKEVTK